MVTSTCCGAHRFWCISGCRLSSVVRFRMSEKHAIGQVNEFSQDEFVRVFGSVFEHSPWIAEAAWEWRPFEELDELHWAMCQVVHGAGEEKQLALIRAHPDLVGRAALA